MRHCPSPAPWFNRTQLAGAVLGPCTYLVSCTVSLGPVKASTLLGNKVLCLLFCIVSTVLPPHVHEAVQSSQAVYVAFSKQPAPSEQNIHGRYLPFLN